MPLGLAALVVVVVLAALSLFDGGPPGEDGPVDRISFAGPDLPTTTLARLTTTTLTSTTTTTLSPLRRVPGWTRLDSGPTESFSAIDATWTDRGLLVVGTDGTALWNPASVVWQERVAPPIESARDVSITTTPSEVVAVADGGRAAALDLATLTWREIPPAPPGTQHVVGLIWGGDRLWLLAHVDPEARLTDRLVFASYEPLTETWETRAQPEFRLSEGDLSWVDGRLLVHGGWLSRDNRPLTPEERPVAAQYDPSSDTWRELPPSPLSPNALASGEIGDALFAFDYLGQAARIAPEAGWELLEPLPFEPGECPVQSVVVGERLLAWACSKAAVWEEEGWRRIETPAERNGFVSHAAVDGQPVAGPGSMVYFLRPGPEPAFWSLDLDAAGTGGVEQLDDWLLLPPGPADGRVGAVVEWVEGVEGGGIVVWGGAPFGSEEPVATGATYHSNLSVWEVLPDSPLNARHDHVSVWTGEHVIIWGGSGGADGAWWDPNNHRWRLLAGSPIPGASGATAVWTGDEMIVWGGQAAGTEPTNLGAAYDPATDTWRPLSEPDVAGRTGHVAAWTGTEMIVYGGFSTDGIWLDDGAAYDPAADAWRAIPGHEGAALVDPAGAWTGEELVVFGVVFSTVEEETVPRLVGLAFDPAANTWRVLPEPQLITTELGAVWGGHSAIVLQGDVFLYLPTSVAAAGPHLWRYSPQSNDWSLVADELPVDVWQPPLVTDGVRIYLYDSDPGTRTRMVAVTP